MYRLTSYIAFSQNNAGVNNVKLLHLVTHFSKEKYFIV